MCLIGGLARVANDYYNTSRTMPTENINTTNVHVAGTSAAASYAVAESSAAAAADDDETAAAVAATAEEVIVPVAGLDLDQDLEPAPANFY
jgi:hypothetical protein